MLDELADQSGAAGELANLLGQARAKLSSDWRPPFNQPDGCILLCRTVTVASHRADVGPAITSAALKKLRDEGWLKIVFVDAGMEPVADIDYDVCLVDGQTKSGKTKTGKTSKEGLARFDGILPGECQVRSPRVKDLVILV